jgi:hypothetical protein
MEWCVRGLSVADDSSGRDVHMADRPEFYTELRSEAELQRIARSYS